MFSDGLIIRLGRLKKHYPAQPELFNAILKPIYFILSSDILLFIGSGEQAACYKPPDSRLTQALLRLDALY
ncbi:hypothetical protein [Neisseria dumasiana]|uniref:Uncharacterized protein n=1 Tax=Neisseria dumasiana TaxID=1931275 RepID=A0A1X3DKH0_9NEIS|nr:hypothetical protein [Neisseria dumasiana]OSI17015.1 hypothetical protein BV914_02425 [Neisseria dumasiana]OSI23926.1 hypothetical protein BV912_03470 [Neisseria dumasiana]OSI32238.1 hypothetical protein BV913_09930 [Neisseria dumasiana]UOO84903.1 hypothetical protein LVJ88_02520 [Neisseria dumasiana]